MMSCSSSPEKDFVFGLVESHLASAIDGHPELHPAWITELAIDGVGPCAKHQDCLKVQRVLDCLATGLFIELRMRLSDLQIAVMVAFVASSSNYNDRPEK